MHRYDAVILASVAPGEGGEVQRRPNCGLYWTAQMTVFKFRLPRPRTRRRRSPGVPCVGEVGIAGTSSVLQRVAPAR